MPTFKCPHDISMDAASGVGRAAASMLQPGPLYKTMARSFPQGSNCSSALGLPRCRAAISGSTVAASPRTATSATCNGKAGARGIGSLVGSNQCPASAWPALGGSGGDVEEAGAPLPSAGSQNPNGLRYGTTAVQLGTSSSSEASTPSPRPLRSPHSKAEGPSKAGSSSFCPGSSGLGPECGIGRMKSLSNRRLFHCSSWCHSRCCFKQDPSATSIHGCPAPAHGNRGHSCRSQSPSKRGRFAHGSRGQGSRPSSGSEA
mmetsp:Transcript_34291/g.106467  ORF Transcript_34291/g.106467 Transcript_34291/m.106467 type:complete len:259 (-) Transcript_34291:122-898(-)